MSLVSEFHRATLKGTLVHYNASRNLQSGFQVEQYLNRFGFTELGRRTNAAAWALPNENAIIRVSEDVVGSREFYSMAQKIEGNPYLPVVFKENTLSGSEHITCVEKLVSLTNKDTFARYKSIHQADQMSLPVTETDRAWRGQMDECFRISTAISKAFSNPNEEIDCSAFVNPGAFREAVVALYDLAESVHKADKRFTPNADMNRSNILFRISDEGDIQPVFNDPLICQNYGKPDIDLANEKREQLGMRPIGFS